MCGRALGSFPLEKLSPPVGAQPGGAVSAAQRSSFVDPGLDGSNRHLILFFGSEGSAGLESSRVLEKFKHDRLIFVAIINTHKRGMFQKTFS